MVPCVPRVYFFFISDKLVGFEKDKKRYWQGPLQLLKDEIRGLSEQQIRGHFS